MLIRIIQNVFVTKFNIREFNFLQFLHFTKCKQRYNFIMLYLNDIFIDCTACTVHVVKARFRVGVEFPESCIYKNEVNIA